MLKININNKPCLVFELARKGEVFVDDTGNVYMKCESSSDDTEYNAVHLETGTLVSFDRYDTIARIVEHVSLNEMEI